MSVRGILESAVPFLGGVLSTAVGAYWIFTQPHLSGVLFRRHLFKLEQFYSG